MSNLTFLVLSGPTREYIDPVRFISNESSGKMGKAVSEEILKRKYNLIFITGPAEFPLNSPSNKLKTIKVISAKDMFCAVKQNLKKADIIISAAAVSDFRVSRSKKHKIKKTGDKFILELVKNPDIIAYCAKNKKNKVIAGFALETQNLIGNSRLKLRDKKLDLIITNGKESFGSDSATMYIINADVVLEIKNKNKKIIAEKIIDETIRMFKNIEFGEKIS